MTIAPELAAAVRELEAYDDEEHQEERAVLALVRAVLAIHDAGAGDVVD